MSKNKKLLDLRSRNPQDAGRIKAAKRKAIRAEVAARRKFPPINSEANRQMSEASAVVFSIGRIVYER